MELVAHRWHLADYRQPVFIHNITDVHRDAAGCDVRQFRKDIAYILQQNKEGKSLHLWLGGGDWHNAISAGDKRFDSTTVAPEFKRWVSNNLHQRVTDKIVEETAPIAKWCLGYGRGNHEDKVLTTSDFDPAEMVARGLDVNYLGYSAGIRITFSFENAGTKVCFKLYWHHGYGASRSRGGRINMLASLGSILADADAVCTGHVHEPLGFPDIRLMLTTRGTLRQIVRPVVYVNGGSYLKGYTQEKMAAQVPGAFNKGHQVEVDYGEKRAYRPSVIGHYGLSLDFFRKGSQSAMDFKSKVVDFR